MNPIRVLYLEDNQSDMEAVRRTLEDTQEFTLIPFTSSTAVLDHAVLAGVDVILLDKYLNHLPIRIERQMTGMGLASWLRDQPTLDHVPIIVTSADAEGLDEYEADNQARGIFAISKDEWGLDAAAVGGFAGAGLVAKLANVLFRWGTFVASRSAQGVRAYSNGHNDFVWPIPRGQDE